MPNTESLSACWAARVRGERGASSNRVRSNGEGQTSAALVIVQQLLRFLAGGVLVSLFAVLGDLFKPKSFAGLFAAAPSVALATLVLTIEMKGAAYAATEARSMVVGAIAFLGYATTVCWSLHRCGGSARARL